jgi:hypothetical protein
MLDYYVICSIYYSHCHINSFDDLINSFEQIWHKNLAIKHWLCFGWLIDPCLDQQNKKKEATPNVMRENSKGERTTDYEDKISI